jgi:cell division protease FtsH
MLSSTQRPGLSPVTSRSRIFNIYALHTSPRRYKLGTVSHRPPHFQPPTTPHLVVTCRATRPDDDVHNCFPDSNNSSHTSWSQRILGAAALISIATASIVRPASAARFGLNTTTNSSTASSPPSASTSETADIHSSQHCTRGVAWQDTGITLADANDQNNKSPPKASNKKNSKQNQEEEIEDKTVDQISKETWTALRHSNFGDIRKEQSEISIPLPFGNKRIMLRKGISREDQPQNWNGESMAAWAESVTEDRPSVGRLIKNPRKSSVYNPRYVKTEEEVGDEAQTLADEGNWKYATYVRGATWTRLDKMRNLTYTQFWRLVTERRIEKVRYTPDRRALIVETKKNAPGGKRIEKVGIPFDPDLFDHMVEHGVYVEEDENPSPLTPMLHSILRNVFPIWFSYWLIKTTFRFGTKKDRDKIFGAAKLNRITKKEAKTSFADVAGIDQVKDEIMEIVQFLRNPRRFLKAGAKSPAGILLVGPPGTGKTLLARAVAGEAGVPFFSVSGTEFMELYVGVGASRVRDMFEQARKNAPCILFIDEFDGVGQARQYGSAGDDESVHTINQLLTEMDGFDDNTGVVVMAATNRPGILDSALTRPGRFDRMVYLPLPNIDGRIEILKVHARGRKVDPTLDYQKIARATAGYTGAELMNLMNTASIFTARQGQPMIGEVELFAAIEKLSIEKMQDTMGEAAGLNYVSDEQRKIIAVYEAARALVGYITPEYDEVQRVSICPDNLATGYTYFLPNEERLESLVTTRGFLESKIVVSLAGRCAEKLVFGEDRVSSAGARDVEAANVIAREMIYRCGFNKRLGPVALMDTEENFLNRGHSMPVADVSREMAQIAYEEARELLEAGEAKAYFGLAANYTTLEALYNKLLETNSLTGKQLTDFLEEQGVVRYRNPFVQGFKWADDGSLVWPGRPDAGRSLDEVMAAEKNGNGSAAAAAGGNRNGTGVDWWSSKNPYQVRSDIAHLFE